MREIPSHIVNLIVSQSWAIDFEYGIKQLNQLLFDLESADKIDYSTKRKENQPTFISLDGTISDSDINISSHDIPKGSILELNMSGVMREEDGLCSYGVKTLSKQFYQAYSNPNIAGILFDVNSGGGESSAGVLLRNTIKDKSKAVVTHFSTLGSAAYMGALYSDEIIGYSEHARSGSIGTFISLDRSFVSWYKENIDDIYSDVSTDKNKEFRAYLNGDYAPMRDMVTKSADLFQQSVKESRKLKGSDTKINETVSGGMYFSKEAKDRGLIDSIGSKNYALKRLRSHINYYSK